MTPKAARETGLRADAARNRARVLQVAREQLATGDDSFMFNSIARLAGVGVGTVYRHFPNRHALVEALMAERFQQLVSEARAAAAEEDASAGLWRLLRYMIEHVLDVPGLTGVLESTSDADARTSAMKADFDGAVGQLLDRAREAGTIRPDLHPDDLRRLFCGIEHAIRSSGDRDRYTELYLGVLFEGLRPPR